MGIPVLDSEPEKVVSGDTLSWRKADFISNFPSPAWALTYELRSSVATGIAVKLTAVQDGTTSGFLISVLASVTAGWVAGTYHWDAYVTKGLERKRVARGVMEVDSNLASEAVNFDARTHVKKTLDALKATLEGKATRDQASYSIEGRSLSRMSIGELIEWKSLYEGFYQSELDAIKLEQGKSPGGQVRTRFV